jgi:hypothetical protein
LKSGIQPIGNLQLLILSCPADIASSISKIVFGMPNPKMRPPAGGNGESDLHRFSIVNRQSAIVNR